MNMNIYITPQNEEKLRQEPSMSGLINSLLEMHYAGKVLTKKIDEDLTALYKPTPAKTKPKKAVEELKKLADIKTADEIAIKAFNDEECQGHETRMNCGLKNCKYA